MFTGIARFTSVALTLVAVKAAAQDSAVKSAADAFGERVGTEQSGLYSETQVRGFDLNESGAYRIDDAYFSRAAALNDPVLAGVGVRVGVNAVRLAYPAPSGVVNYRLREAGPANELRLGVGLRDFGTRVVQADGSFRDGDFSFAGGFVWRPLWRLAQGYEGRALDVGGVGAWQISPDQRLRAFATMYQRSYDGDYAVVPSEAGRAADSRDVAPILTFLGAYGSAELEFRSSLRWANRRLHGRPHGLPFDLRYRRTDYTLISADATGLASATTYRNPDRAKRADSAEARVGRRFESGGLSHLATVSLRGGRTIVDLTSNLSIPLGTFDLRDDDLPDGVEQPWSGTRGTDTVEQVTASAAYGLAWRDRLQLRFAVHGRAMKRTCCRSPVCAPMASAKPLSTMRPPSSVSRIARPCSAVG